MNAVNHQASNSSNWLRTFSIGFSIISFGITIAIIGYIVLTAKQNQPANQQPTSPTISQPSPTSNDYGESTKSAETTNWKTYTNSKYSLSFQYPPTLYLRLAPGSNGDSGKMLSLGFISSDNKTQLFVWAALTRADLRNARGNEGNKQIYSTTIKIDGYTAIEQVFETDPTAPFNQNATVLHNTYLASFQDRPLDVELFGVKGTVSLEQFDQILSTFQFSN